MFDENKQGSLVKVSSEALKALPLFERTIITYLAEKGRVIITQDD